MSVTATYKGKEILSITADAEAKLKTGGKYCEDDITLINTQDGSAPVADTYDAESIDNGDGTQTLAISDVSGTLSNGIVFTAVDSSQRPTACTVYGTAVPSALFGRHDNETWTAYGMREVTKVHLAPSVTAISESAFRNSFIEEITGTEHLTNINYPSSNGSAFAFARQLKAIRLPNVNLLPQYTFNVCTSLCAADIGSCEQAVTVHPNSFYGCTQSGLTITLYTTGAYADTAVANVRNGATNATIIIKAAEDTEYNGSTFAAGETIITSIVEEGAE